MTASLAVNNVLHYQYAGFDVSVKNTFIDVSPRRSQQRSRSSAARFESFDPKSTLLDVKSVADLQSTACSSTSDGGDQEQPGSQASRHRSGSDAPESSIAGEDFVAEQFQKYLVDTNNGGITLMWHGLPTKYHVTPDLIEIIEEIDAQGVGYLYLPLNHWEKSRVSCGKCRNKGYAFLHFKTIHDAEAFTKRIADFTIESRRTTATTLAAHQGISLNLYQLVTAPQKRTAAGTIYLPNAEGTLECVTISSLRKLHKSRLEMLQK
jgi:hypothetical protein